MLWLNRGDSHEGCAVKYRESFIRFEIRQFFPTDCYVLDH
jgi:hypothetical protein